MHLYKPETFVLIHAVHAVQGPDQVVSFTHSIRPEVYIDVESHEMTDRTDMKSDVFDESPSFLPTGKVAAI